MNFRRPPRLAVWLLNRFGLTRDESLAGDLFEEFRGGRTAGWFWRQTLTAIFAAMCKSARRTEVRKLIIAYAITTSITVSFLQVNGRLVIHASWASVLSAVGFVVGLTWLTETIRPTGYWSEVARQSGRLLASDCVWILPCALLNGDLCSPVFMFCINLQWLEMEIRRAIKRQPSEVR